MNFLRRTFLASLAMGIVVLAGARTSSAVDPQSASQVEKDTPDTGVKMAVEGLVRDIACPIQNHESKARDFNLDCALACARKGSPLVILTDSGAMYIPISDKMPDVDARQKLMPFVGKYVHASGTVYRRSGTRAIIIKQIAEMKDVKLKIALGDD